MHSEICPVCKGKGKVLKEHHEKKRCYIICKWKVCHGCNGKGWVEVGNSYTSYVWPDPWPYNPYPIWWETDGTGTTIVTISSTNAKEVGE